MQRTTLAVFSTLFAFGSAGFAVEKRHEITMQGTGFFIADTPEYEVISIPPTVEVFGSVIGSISISGLQ